MKRLLTLMFAVIAVLTISAKPITRNAAMQRAAQFAQRKGGTLVGEPRVAPGRKASAAQQPLYVFNMADNGGFVIVAGDDKARLVLGYTTQGSYDENDMPENFRLWMEQMAREIEAANEEGDSLEEEEDTRQRIEPLIQTLWNQGRAQAGGYIFNMFCPEIEGKRAVTGCVATAGAQIMYYYQHPKDSIGGVPGYVLENAVADTSEPLDSTIFRWEAMKPVYSYRDHGTESAEAVSELMLYCGYAANMNYGLAGSGSNERTLVANMVKYFDYDPYTVQVVERSQYSIAGWEDLIYSELQQGRPVIYSGTSNKGGHTFICDGYDGDGYYHFNWGWGGLDDGYFTLYATNPDGINDITTYGYIMDQAAVIGIQPNTGEAPEVEPLLDEKEEEVGDLVLSAPAERVEIAGATLSVTYSYTYDEPSAFSSIGLAELLPDDEMKILVDVDLGGATLKKGSMVSCPYNLRYYVKTEGVHTIIPVCLQKDSTVWKRCKPLDLYYEVVKGSDGQYTITVNSQKTLVVNSFEVTSPGIPYERQTAKLSITNNGDFYDSYLKLILCQDRTEKELFFNFDGGMSTSTWQKVMIKHGNTKNYNITFLDPENKLAPGKYVLKVCDVYSNECLDSTSFGLGQDLAAIDAAVVGSKYIGDMHKVDVTIENRSGDYTKPLYLFASRTEEKGKSVYAVGTAIESGKSQMLEFYFKPAYSGDWNLWVTLDEKGNDVIWHEVVPIVREPEEMAKAMDLDNDGEVTTKDIASLSKLIANASSPINFIKADINGDGKADITDLFMLFKKFLPEEPPYSPTTGWPAAYDGIMLQAFYWDSYDDTQWTTLESQADDLAGTFDLVWLPQSGNCGGQSMGYDDLYWFTDYNSSFGNEEQLRSLISTFGEKGIKTIADVVINHRRNVSNWVDFPKETYNGVTYEMTSTDIVKNDDGGATLNWANNNGYQLSENEDTGTGWNGMRDLDHNSENVQTIVKAYLDFLKIDLGYAGFRYDMVKGYSPSFIGTYNTSAQPEFSVGECWDSSNTIKEWIDGTKADGIVQSAAFDFQFKYVVRNATDEGKWNKLGEQNEGSWPLVSSSFEDGSYRRYAVTFVENHDTQVRQNGTSAGPLTKDTLAANAYMMAMPGTPCVFLPHWKDYAPQIKTMVAARRLAGINSESSYVPYSSSEDYYATVSSTEGENRLLAVVGNVEANEANVDAQQWTKITEGYHYAYYFSTTMNTAYADLPSGKYEGRQEVMLAAVTADADAVVVYTLDGSDPIADGSDAVPTGTRITLPFGSTTLKAAILAGGVMGEVITRTYEVRPSEKDVPVEIPSFCTVAEGETCAFFEAPALWTAPIMCWAWNYGDNFTGGEWPGQACEMLGMADSGHFVWKWTYGGSLEAMPTDIIFSNSGAPQTNDLPFQNGGYYTVYGQKGVVSQGD